VSALRHTFPKLKPFPIYADTIDDTAVHRCFEMAARYFLSNGLYAERNHPLEFMPLRFRGRWIERDCLERLFIEWREGLCSVDQ